ncbi:MAG: ribose 5-phosphate isomerase B [Desulfovibrio sp.]|jgi:ribose 5-phosphate isomerase B|nr:ribose 5-phosphate isomerase B [Desulfovibrio sp.]
MTGDTVFIASDHAGFAMKQALCADLAARGFRMEDLGPQTAESCDYPVFAHALCARVLENAGRGILICGTGIGMCMAANRHRGIRAALCTDEYTARACRAHNNADVLCLGARVVAPALAAELAVIFLSTAFEGGRHARRVALIESS